MIAVKRFILLGLACSLSSCFVPGTYYSNDTINQGYVVDGKREKPKVIRLDGQWLAKQSTPAPYTYKVGPYDILNIIVWDHPELTTPSTQLSDPSESGILVDGEGYITFPFAGRVKVAGLSLREVEEKIKDNIKKYINHPQITVRVAVFRSKDVSLVGEVKKAGLQAITDKPLSVMQAIDDAGGVNANTADTRKIYILRQEENHLSVYWFNAQDPMQLTAANKFWLMNDDIVYVPPAGVSSWNRVITQILPTVGGAGSVKNISE